MLYRIFAVVVFVAAIALFPSASLAGGGTQSVQLISPNGGEEWMVGSTQTVSWEYGGSFPESARYQLWLVGVDVKEINKIYDGKIYDGDMDGFGLESPATSFNWQIPANAAVGRFKVGIVIYLPAANDSSANTEIAGDVSFAPFNIVAAPKPATVWLNTPELHNQKFYSPIELMVGASGVYSADIAVFSNILMPAVWAELAQNIPWGWTMNYNFDANGMFRIVMAGSQPLEQDKPFLKIFFRTTALNLGDSASCRLLVKLNEDPELYIQGMVTFTSLYGDISMDGLVSSYDASILLRWFVGLTSGVDYPGITEKIADVSGNGQITPFDAALIFQYDAGLISRFPADEDKRMKVAASQPARVWLGQMTSDASGYAIPVVVDQMNGILAGQLEIGPVGDGVLVEPTNLLKGYQVVTNRQNGKLLVSFAGASSPEGGGEMFRLKFTTRPQRLTAKIQINEYPAVTLSTAVQQTSWGRIKAGFIAR